MKITDKMRAEWLIRKDTEIVHPLPGTWESLSRELNFCWLVARTKRAAIDKAIRAEAKGKK